MAGGHRTGVYSLAMSIFNNAKLYSKIKIYQGNYSIVKISTPEADAELIETPDEYWVTIPPDASYIFFVVDWSELSFIRHDLSIPPSQTIWSTLC